MNRRQQQFLQRVASQIPRLMKQIADGNERAELILGTRIVEGRQIRLLLVVEVVDPGANPLETHGAGSVAPQSATDENAH